MYPAHVPRLPKRRSCSRSACTEGDNGDRDRPSEIGTGSLERIRDVPRTYFARPLDRFLATRRPRRDSCDDDRVASRWNREKRSSIVFSKLRRTIRHRFLSPRYDRAIIPLRAISSIAIGTLSRDFILFSIKIVKSHEKFFLLAIDVSRLISIPPLGDYARARLQSRFKKGEKEIEISLSSLSLSVHARPTHRNPSFILGPLVFSGHSRQLYPDM